MELQPGFVQQFKFQRSMKQPIEVSTHFTHMNYYKHCKAVENQTLSFLKAKAAKRNIPKVQYGDVCGTAVPRSLDTWSFRYTV